MKVRLVILLLAINGCLAAQPYIVSDVNNNVFISKGIGYFIDSTKSLQPEQLLDSNIFKSNKGRTPVFTVDVNNVWLKFSIINNASSNLYLEITYTNISKLSLYKVQNGNIQLVSEAGNSLLLKGFNPGNPNIVFNLKMPQHAKQDFFLHVESIHPIILPMYVSTGPELIKSGSLRNLFTGFYFGLLVVLFFYNFFIFVSTRDINYLFYIVYIFTLIFAQLAASGYGYFYVWPNNPGWNKYIVLWASYFSGITAFIFSLSFLHVRHYAKKIFPFLFIIFVVYAIGLAASLFNNFQFSYIILNYNSLLTGLVALALSIYIAKKGYRPAFFYLVAWIFFLVSVIILVLRNINVLPYNDFTSSAFYIGSALEVTLLSIALADRINILKKEKDLSQAEALRRAKENERLVKEQNIILENKVKQRTHELEQSNVDLSDALENLKDTQTQLVEAEKMASLGQLTAGIAHEINNPINFVKSNINPLRLDVKDLIEVLNAYGELHTANNAESYLQKLNAIKELKDTIDVEFIQSEIDNLIVGIEEGAERTAEIVKGLRTFSRIDEAALKKANIHDGILSTLVLLKNNLPYYIKVVRHFKANGEIECFPGKLNQVFMNILTNSIQAIKSKPQKTDDEFIIISTRDMENDAIEISIKDSGIGMSEEVKHHIYEPFFTTKDIGEGTGLGMAIVFKIIQKHEGKINILSSPNEGAEFIITLPRHQDSD